MLQLKKLRQRKKLRPKKLHLLKMLWLLKIQWVLKSLLLLKTQWLKLHLQTKLLHLLKKLLPSKFAVSEIPIGELEEGQSGNWLALFFV